MAPSGDPGVPTFGVELGPQAVLAVSFFVAGKNVRRRRRRRKKNIWRIIPPGLIGGWGGARGQLKVNARVEFWIAADTASLFFVPLIYLF